MRAAVAVAAALAAVGSPAPAAASSIVFIKGGNVWLAAADGSNQRQVTTGGYWDSPSQANDGTILAQRATQLYRMNRQGTALAPPIDTIFTGAPSTWAGPVGTVISPDGVSQAYGGEVTDSGYFDTGCNCWVYTHTFTTLWGSATSYSQPDQTLGQQDYVDPAWIDSGHLLLTSAGILIDQVATYAVGGGDNTMIQWFSDPDSTVTSLNDPAISPDHQHLAFVANVGGGLGNEIRIYTAASAPPVPGGPAVSAPVDTCNIGPNPFESLRVSFSPDGQSLVYDASDGIHLVSLAGLPSCAGLDDRLIIPGGSLPYFGPANVAPTDGIQPGNGGGGTGGGGTGGGGSGGAGQGGGTFTISRMSVARDGTITLAVSAGVTGRLSASATATDAAGARRHAVVAVRPRRHQSSTLSYGSSSVRLAHPGTARLRITPTRAARLVLRRVAHLKVTIAVTFIPSCGHRRTAHTSITVRGRR
jgi:hypothetical protein